MKRTTKLGINEIKLLRFVIKYEGWHSVKKDLATQKAAKGLEDKGFIQSNQFGQIILKRA